jgi:hypothetical protein
VWLSQARLAGWTAAKLEITPGFILADVLRVFSVGPSTPPGFDAWQALMLALLLAGVVPGRRRMHSSDVQAARGQLAAALWLALPIGLIVLLSLRQPYYKARFLLPALPAFQLLAGYGAARLSGMIGRVLEARPGAWRVTAARLAGPFLAVLLIATAWQPLRNEWFDPAFWRDDYRGAAREIALTAGPRDALILNGQSQIETLDLYLKGPQPRFLIPRFRPLDAAATAADLQAILAAHRRIYGLFYVLEESDPGGMIASWLDTHAFRASSRWYGGLQLVVWEGGALAGPAIGFSIPFVGGPTLENVVVAPAALRPTEALRAQVTWSANRQVAGGAPLNVFAHVIGADGQLVGQYDGPLDGGGPTRFAIVLPADTAPGSYRLRVGLYDPATGARLRTARGDDGLDIAALMVVPR